MDKGTKVILVVLGILCMISIATAASFFLSERRTYRAYNEMQTKLTRENANLTESLLLAQKEKTALEKRLDEADRDLETANRELTQAMREAKESEEKLNQRITENEKLTRQVKVLDEKRAVLEAKMKEMESEPFLAGLLTERASLAVELDSLKNKVSTQTQVLKQAREDKQKLELRLAELVTVKEEIESQLGKDRALADTLSQELLKAEKSRIQVQVTLEEEKEEKFKLQAELGKMREAEGSWERKIAELQGNLQRAEAEFRQNMQKTEAEFQQNMQKAEEEKFRLSEEIEYLNDELETKMMEINEVKEMVERVIGGRSSTAGRDIVELSPIIVKADTAPSPVSYESSFSEQDLPPAPPVMPLAPEHNAAREAVVENTNSAAIPVTVSRPEPGERQNISLEGEVIVVNERHNFVVIDKGGEHGVKLGMPFRVYRDNKKIGTLEVIEIRDRISACNVAELMEKNKIRTKDVVKY